MSYENAIARFRALYRQATREEVLREFEQDDGDLGIYVHSPFCVSVCKFCHYKGVQFDCHRDSKLYRHYYGDYLPRVIEPFLPLIAARNVTNYFFGGGTPSLMNADTMREVFRLLPDLGAAPSRTFEIHPAIWDEGQLDVLAEFGFTCGIIGIQSFDAAVLARQHRPYAAAEKVRTLAAALKERGIAVAADIIYHMDAIDAGTIFARDLQELLDIDLDIITLQHNFNDRENHAYPNEFHRIIERSALLDDYRWEFADRVRTTGPPPLPHREEEKYVGVVRLVAKTLDLDDYRTRLFPFTTEAARSKLFPGAKRTDSVLGLGSYKNSRSNTASYIRRKDKLIKFIEVNNDWQPEYYVVYERHVHDLFSRTTSLLGRLQAVGEVPAGIKVSPLNTTRVTAGDSIYCRPESVVMLELGWQRQDPRIDAFIGKVKRRFPDHEEFACGLRIGEGQG